MHPWSDDNFLLQNQRASPIPLKTEEENVFKERSKHVREKLTQERAAEMVLLPGSKSKTEIMYDDHNESDSL